MRGVVEQNECIILIKFVKDRFKVTNIYPSFIADDAKIMAKRPVVLK